MCLVPAPVCLAKHDPSAKAASSDLMIKVVLGEDLSDAGSARDEKSRIASIK